jgi:hypothetical protein
MVCNLQDITGLEVEAIQQCSLRRLLAVSSEQEAVLMMTKAQYDGI